MKFGVCGGPEEAGTILAAGFDYVEVGAVGFRGLEPEWDPSPYTGLRLPVTNLFFDARVHFFGRERTPHPLYARRTIERAATLGVRTMVIGSGRTRRAPEGFDGLPPFLEILAELQEMATPHGITIAPESLNAEETNVGNSLMEIVLPLVGRESGIGFTLDSYHLLKEWKRDSWGETVDEMWASVIPGTPTHVHVAPLDRGAPRADDPMLRSFARYVREDLGYDGLVSLEANRGPEFDLAAANADLRELFG